MAFKQRTRIAQWNVRTLAEASKLAQLVNSMNQLHVELIGISEARWRNCGEFQTNGYTFLYSGKADKDEYGVGILMSAHIRKALIEWNPVNERIITARVKTRARNISFVQCYAPTEVDSADVKNAFYEQLSTTLDQISKGDIVILMGDFNAKIGSDNSNYESIMGKHALGNTRSDNGERLVELCSQHNLVIGGSLFPHKDVHKFTWTSPRSSSIRNQIDHICISKKWRKMLLDVRNKRSADIYSDHELLMATIQLKVMAVQRRNRTPQRMKVNLSNLKVPELKRAYVNKLKELAQSEIDWRNCHVEAVQSTIGFQTHQQRKPWISDETMRMIEVRRTLKNVASQRQQYNEINVQIKRAARRDRRNYTNMFAAEAEEAASKFDMRTLYRRIGSFTNGNLSRNMPINDKTGNCLASSEAQLVRWKQHFDELLNTVNDENAVSQHEEPYSDATSAINTNIATRPPSIAEIATAIQSLKLNKAAGSDGVALDLLAADARTSAKIIHKDITDAWESERLQDEWKKGLIVKLPKKGDLKVCDNWRGITILNAINKVMAQVIHNRISKHLEGTLCDEQAGFRPNRGCIDQSNALRLIIEQSNEFNTPLYMVFVDFEKAFDRVNREAIWSALKRRQIPNKIIRLIRAMYENAKCQVMHNGALTDEFGVNTGVRQGCILSPLLFLTVLDDVLKEALPNTQGIWWTPTRKLSHLDYADDICLLSNSHSEMQAMLAQLNAAALRKSLKINERKTKLMRINANNLRPISLNNSNIQEVEKFCYLGSMMSVNGGTREDINSRIAKAALAYGRLNKVWLSSELSSSTKLRIFKACVLSTLLYGSETWSCTELEIARVQTFVNKCLRKILRIFYPETITNNELYERAQIDTIDNLVKQKKWRWIGHTLRRTECHITRQALEWNPQGSRRRGRPRLTWRRKVENELTKANSTWTYAKQLAENRIRWKAFVSALCSNRS